MCFVLSMRHQVCYPYKRTEAKTVNQSLVVCGVERKR